MVYGKHFIIIILLACGLKYSVEAKPAAKVEDNGTGDYYSDDDYENYSDDNEVNPSNDSDVGVLGEPAYFIKNELSVYANEGSSQILKCDAENLKGTDVVMWYNGTQIMAQGGAKLSKNPRVRLLDNNGIEIADIVASDAGIYSCTLLPSKASLNIFLNIVQPIKPDVSIWYRDANVSNNILTVHQTDHVEFNCNTKSISNPTIKWSLNGHRIGSVSDDILVEEDRIIIDVVDHSHAGIYQCLADDKSKHPHLTSVTLDVLYPPRLKTHRHHINTDKNEDAELYCVYKANPISEIIWKKEEIPLESYSDKYIIKNGHNHEENNNRTTLIIKDVKSKDLGNYTCSVKNAFGEKTAKMELSFNPENPQFEGMTINGRTVTLHWLVRSIQPLTEAVLKYKIDKQYQWTSDSILNTNKHQDNHKLWKLTHTMELTEGLWVAQVRTKNTHGWSQFSEEHSFVVTDNPELDEDEDEEAGNDPQNINLAGIIPTKNKNNGASTTFSSGSFPGFSLCLLALTYLVRNL